MLPCLCINISILIGKLVHIAKSLRAVNRFTEISYLLIFDLILAFNYYKSILGNNPSYIIHMCSQLLYPVLVLNCTVPISLDIGYFRHSISVSL